MRILLLSMLCFCSMCLSAQHSVYYFPFASSEITDESLQALNSLISRVKEANAKVIEIKGHTDRSGKEDYNQTLSHKRASAVMAILQRSLPDVKIMISSHGEDQLITENDDDQHLNRRVEVFVQTVVRTESEPVIKTADIIHVDPFLEDVEEQRFNVNLDDTVKIWAKEGTFIKIDPGSIQNKEGKPVTGNAEIIIKEYYDPAKILLSGLNSASEQGLLQTGGMASFKIMQGDQEMNSDTRKPVLIRMPQRKSELVGMNVFTAQPESTPDTSATGTLMWNNTNQPFIPMRSYWQRPISPLLADVGYESDDAYTQMRIGSTFQDEYRPQPSPIVKFNRFYKRRNAKKVKYSRHKVNDSTIEMRVKIRYKGRGYRAFHRRTLDTAYSLKYFRPQYEGITYTLNLINVDRLYQGGRRIDQYVSIPGISGMTVLAYFKSISAYLPASGSHTGSVLWKVPVDVPVILIAIGKKGDDFYFGRKEYITNAMSPCVMKVEKMTEEAFRNEMKLL